jgi:hypothetical protein
MVHSLHDRQAITRRNPRGKTLHGGQGVAGRVLGKIGQPMIVVVPADERRIHRTPREVAVQDIVEPGTIRRLHGEAI